MPLRYFTTAFALTALLCANLSAAQSVNSNGSATVEKKICIDSEMTGSRLQRRVCKTLSEWKAILTIEEFAALEAGLKKK